MFNFTPKYRPVSQSTPTTSRPRIKNIPGNIPEDIPVETVESVINIEVLEHVENIPGDNIEIAEIIESSEVSEISETTETVESQGSAEIPEIPEINTSRIDSTINMLLKHISHIDSNISDIKINIQYMLEIQNSLLNELKNLRQEYFMLKTELTSNDIKQSDEILSVKADIRECYSQISISENKIRHSFKTHFETMGRFQEQIRDQFMEKIRNGEFVSEKDKQSTGDFFKFFFDVGTSIASMVVEKKDESFNTHDYMKVAKTIMTHEYLKDPNKPSFFDSEQYKSYEIEMDNKYRNPQSSQRSLPYLQSSSSLYRFLEIMPGNSSSISDNSPSISGDPSNNLSDMIGN